MTGTPGPLYRDPLHDGAADPTVIWNPREKAWWMLYTSRRTEDPSNGVGWVHGTPLGVASSTDHGRTWTYRGDVQGLAAPGERGHDTFWAPEVVVVDGLFHMYVSFIPGVPTAWAGHPRTIRHYVSTDLVSWEYRGTLALSSDRVIDACVYPLPGGGYRMWYKDEADGNNIWAADSADLETWTVTGRVLDTPFALEGPYVFRLGEHYWMIADSKCQHVYRSDDLTNWTHTGIVLDIASGASSGRVDDLGPGLHAQVVVSGDVGWMFYFTHPDRHRPDLVGADMRRSSIQVAALEVRSGSDSSSWSESGDLLLCRRDDSVSIDLSLAEPA